MQNELVMQLLVINSLVYLYQLLVIGVFVIQLFNNYHYQIESESTTNCNYCNCVQENMI